MQLPYLIRVIESHAEDLTREVLADLRGATETSYLRCLPEDEVRKRVQSLYANLDRWLTARGDYDIRLLYRQLGSQRCEEGVPASEVVFALLSVKRRLWEFIQRNASIDSAVQLYQEEELFSTVSHFFDVAVYSVVDGHEATRAAGRWVVSRAR